MSKTERQRFIMNNSDHISEIGFFSRKKMGNISFVNEDMDHVPDVMPMKELSTMMRKLRLILKKWSSSLSDTRYLRNSLLKNSLSFRRQILFYIDSFHSILDDTEKSDMIRRLSSDLRLVFLTVKNRNGTNAPIWRTSSSRLSIPNRGTIRNWWKILV